jgi:hypothetical protein
MFAAKIKKDWVRKDKGYEDTSLIERRRAHEEEQERKLVGEHDKRIQIEKERYEAF